MEASAKSGFNVDEAFTMIVKNIYENAFIKGDKSPPDGGKEPIKITPVANNSGAGKDKCCK